MMHTVARGAVSSILRASSSNLSVAAPLASAAVVSKRQCKHSTRICAAVSCCCCCCFCCCCFCCCCFCCCCFCCSCYCCWYCFCCCCYCYYCCYYYYVAIVLRCWCWCFCCQQTCCFFGGGIFHIFITIVRCSHSTGHFYRQWSVKEDQSGQARRRDGWR